MVEIICQECSYAERSIEPSFVRDLLVFETEIDVKRVGEHDSFLVCNAFLVVEFAHRLYETGRISRVLSNAGKNLSKRFFRLVLSRKLHSSRNCCWSNCCEVWNGLGKRLQKCGSTKCIRKSNSQDSLPKAPHPVTQGLPSSLSIVLCNSSNSHKPFVCDCANGRNLESPSQMNITGARNLAR